jgi:hypothetical protein
MQQTDLNIPANLQECCGDVPDVSTFCACFGESVEHAAGSQDSITQKFEESSLTAEQNPDRHVLSRLLAGDRAGEKKLKGYAHSIAAGQRLPTLPANFLLSEVDMLDEHDLAVIVFDDVVAVEPIAVLIEIVGALGADVALDAQDRLANLLRLKALSVVDRER